MTNPAEINGIVNSSFQSIDYKPSDKAIEEGQAKYIQSNLTALGHKSGENVAGFTSLAKEVDYDHELIMGSTPVVFNKDPGVGVTGLMVKPDQVSVTGRTINYTIGFNEVTGCNPNYSAQTPTKTLEQMLGANAGILQPEVSHNHRIVCAGSPLGTVNALNTLNGMTGPYLTPAQGGDTSLVPKITVTDANRTAVANAVSSLTD
jgi:hypothetical protein